MTPPICVLMDNQELQAAINALLPYCCGKCKSMALITALETLLDVQRDRATWEPITETKP